MERWDFVIVGAGAAGLAAAKEIRGYKKYATILIVSDEAPLPYKRTKISKIYAQQLAFGEIAMEPDSFYSEGAIRLKSRSSVVKIDAQRHQAELNDGTTVEYEKLLIASGATPVLPVVDGLSAEDTHVFWNRAHFEKLKRDTASAREVVVVGMGVLGVEMAEQLTLSGKKVLLIGHGTRPMARYLSPDASQILRKGLEKHGVVLGFEEEVRSVNRLSQTDLEIVTSNRTVRAGAILFCIGARPSLEIARASEIEFETGICVDDHLRTSVEDVYAAGDVAQHRNGEVSHLWHSAEDQGIYAARAMLGKEDAFITKPYRLKCEVFDTYVFSLAEPRLVTGCRFEEHLSGSRYLGIYEKNGATMGIVMANDKDNAKAYEKAVRDCWPIGKVTDLFS